MDSSRFATLPDPRIPGAAQRLPPCNADVALELSQLRAAVNRLGDLAERSEAEHGYVITLAWLRRITHEVDRLDACWRGSLPAPAPTPNRRRNDAAPRAR